MTPDENKAKRPKRRWLQFSITALLVLTAFCAILAAWLSDRQRLLHEMEVLHRRAAEAQMKAEEARMHEVQMRDMAERERQRAEVTQRISEHVKKALESDIEQLQAKVLELEAERAQTSTPAPTAEGGDSK